MVDVVEILIPVAVVGGIGCVLAVVLTIAHRFMSNEVNEKEKLLFDALPGANCGGCGYPGCEAYAKALAEGKTKSTNLCAPGKKEVAEILAGVLGTDAGEVKEQKAFVHCRGDCNHNGIRADYNGIASCAARNIAFGGEKACTQGCLGGGDCAAVCPADAIYIENGIAKVNTCKCISCGACVKVCPNRIISLIDMPATAAIACSNTEKGAVTRKKCDTGCIACLKCQKICPTDAIIVKDNLSRIDYEKCIRCGQCVEVCPVHCIAKI